MPKKPLPTPQESNGQRLARLRRAAGFSQRSLAQHLGVSQRMIAYYEAQAGRPPAHLLPALAEAFGVSADELLGVASAAASDKPKNQRLWRRLRQIEELPPKERKELSQIIDVYLERHQLRRSA